MSRRVLEDPVPQYVNQLGYVSLFPFLLHIVDPASPNLVSFHSLRVVKFYIRPANYFLARWRYLCYILVPGVYISTPQIVYKVAICPEGNLPYIQITSKCYLIANLHST